MVIPYQFSNCNCNYILLHISSTIVLEICRIIQYTYYKTRICALSWSNTKIILRCTVRKTSQFLTSVSGQTISPIKGQDTKKNEVEETLLLSPTTTTFQGTQTENTLTHSRLISRHDIFLNRPKLGKAEKIESSCLS